MNKIHMQDEVQFQICDITGKSIMNKKQVAENLICLNGIFNQDIYFVTIKNLTENQNLGYQKMIVFEQLKATIFRESNG